MNSIYERDNSDSDSEFTTHENNTLFSQDNESGFSSDLVIHQDQMKKISKIKLDLNKNKVFDIHNSLAEVMRKAFRRKNEILYNISTKEMSIDINDVSGQVYLPLITKREISEKLSKIDPELRKKISMVHIGAVKILLKAQFREGIDTPIKMALIDNRINSRKDCILGAAKGNLAYGRFMFTVYPKFGVSLSSANLDQTLSFIHNFERSDLMNKGDKVFSITYLVGYALSNSHHSIDYKSKSNIELEDVFREIGTIEQSQFCTIQNDDTQWALDIAKNKPFLGQPERRSFSDTITRKFSQNPIPRSFSQRHLEKGESSSVDKNLYLKSVSNKIDDMVESIKKIHYNE